MIEVSQKILIERHPMALGRKQIASSSNDPGKDQVRYCSLSSFPSTVVDPIREKTSWYIASNDSQNNAPANSSTPHRDVE